METSQQDNEEKSCRTCRFNQHHEGIYSCTNPNSEIFDEMTYSEDFCKFWAGESNNSYIIKVK